MDLGKACDRGPVAVDQVMEQVAGPNGRQLIRIPHQQHHGVIWDCIEHGSHQTGIEHRCFIDHHGITLQGVHRVIHESLLRIVVEHHMNR